MEGLFPMHRCNSTGSAAPSTSGTRSVASSSGAETPATASSGGGPFQASFFLSPPRDNVLSSPSSDSQQSAVIDYPIEGTCSEVFQALLEMYKDDVLCDVELIVGTYRIKAHKVILAAASQYFRAMFTANMRESQQQIIEMKDIDGSAVQLLIDFVYTQKISLSPANIEGILLAANELAFVHVIDACTQFLKQHMNFNNCISIRNLAEDLNIASLTESADKYILDNFLQISGGDDFTLLPVSCLKAVISSPDINITDESEVFEAVMLWMKADLECRKQHLLELLGAVRLPMLATKYLLETVEQDDVFRSNLANCRTLLDEAKNFQLQSGSVPIRSERMLPRNATAGVLFCIGGRGATGDPFRTTEVYNPRKKRWFQIAEMSTKRRHVGVCSIDGKVYAAGGHDGKRHLKSVELYDTRQGLWTVLSPMQTHRRGLAVVSLSTAIYAVGGLDDSSCFDTVERYDTQSDTWTSVASMNHRRGGAGLVALNGFLYAIGGNDGVSSLSCCEKYDPYLNKWTEICSMTVRRAGAGIAVYGDKIFAAGGFDDNSPLNCVECYDPHANAWSALAPMLSSRGGVGLACLGGRLFAVGGHDGQNYLDTVETYDPLRDKWEQSSNINVPRAGAGVVAVKCLASKLQENSKLNVQSYV